LISAGYGDKESMGGRWDQVPMASRGVEGRQAREQDKGGRSLLASSALIVPLPTRQTPKAS
jgi:hypothetical protein